MAGVLTEIKVGEGATVEINTVVAVIGGSTPNASVSTSIAPAIAKPSAPAPKVQLATPQAMRGRTASS